MSALLGGDKSDRDERMDRLGLATMAGWKVKKRITHGSFAWSASFAQTGRVERAIVAAFERPWARQHLLSEEYDTLSVGTFSDEKNQLTGLLFGVYDALSDADIERFKTTALRRLDEQRQAQKAPKRRGYTEMKDIMAKVEGELRAGKTEEQDAFEDALEVAAEVTPGIPVTTWRYSANDANAIVWPEDWARHPRFHIITAAYAYAQEGSPWSYISLLSVAALPGGATTAAVNAPTRGALAAK